MKISSSLKAIAGGLVASLLLVTANPVQADPVSSPFTEAIETIAEQAGPYLEEEQLIPSREALAQKAAKADATIETVRDNGNTVVLGKGHFERRGDKLAIVGESGKTLVTTPLQGLFGDQMMPLNVIVKDGGTAATFSPASTSFQPVPVSIQEARAGLIGDDSRLREFYEAWGKYLNRAEVENFPLVIAGGMAGGVMGAVGGWGLGFLAAAMVSTGMLLFTLVPVVGWIAAPFILLTVIPVAIAVFFAVGVPASAAGIPLGSLLGTMTVGLLSPNELTRKLALEAIAATLALIFLWWLPPSAGDKAALAAGSGVGPTGPESEDPNASAQKDAPKVKKPELPTLPKPGNPDPQAAALHVA